MCKPHRLTALPTDSTATPIIPMRMIMRTLRESVPGGRGLRSAARLQSATLDRRPGIRRLWRSAGLPAACIQPARGPQGSDPYYSASGHAYRERATRSVRRKRAAAAVLLTVMAVLALAVVGTAAAFGYRTVFSNSGSAVSPPTIKADAGPNKVVPTAQSGDASGKLIYDRVGDKSQTERVVSREEQPVDLKTAPPPRVVLRPACRIRSPRFRTRQSRRAHPRSRRPRLPRRRRRPPPNRSEFAR